MMNWTIDELIKRNIRLLLPLKYSLVQFGPRHRIENVRLTVCVALALLTHLLRVSGRNATLRYC